VRPARGAPSFPRMDPLEISLGAQLARLAVLAIPVACVSWTVTHEEVFREPREYCVRESREAPSLARRKFFYLFTCEYCFSHYVAILALWLTRFPLFFSGWRGYLFAMFTLVWFANLYMSAFGRLRLGIKHERTAIAATEKEIELVEQEEGSEVGR
jgi:hypothetical protein